MQVRWIVHRKNKISCTDRAVSMVTRLLFKFASESASKPHWEGGKASVSPGGPWPLGASERGKDPVFILNLNNSGGRQFRFKSQL